MSTLTCAIQLGSSRILAIAAEKDLSNGTLTNIQIESEVSSDCISHGRIVNIEKTAMHIRALIQKLGNRMRTPIAAAYVGVGGMSLHSLVQQPSVKIPDYDVLNSQPISDNQHQLIVGEKRIRESIRAAMDRAGIRIVDIIVLPIATANILTRSARQDGCILVDMGAGTTTVSIYKDGELKHLAVIPLGGECVTYDILSAGCNYDDAERIKRDWSDVSLEVTPESPAGNAPSAMFAERALPIPQSKLNNIALCRYEEIAANIEHQIEASGFKDKLKAGCILTGGAASQNGITTLLLRRLSIPQVEMRASHVPALLNSDRKPDLTNLPRPTPVTRPVTPPQPAPADDNEPTLEIPDREPEPESVVQPEPQTDPKPQTQTEKEPEEEVRPSTTFGEFVGRFVKDLFTGQK